MQYKRAVFFVGIIILLYVISSYSPSMKGVVGKAILNEREQEFGFETATLLRVVDGDTIEALVENETWKIRLQGINTPEKGKPFSNEAKDFLKQFENKSIQLMRDFEDTDRYDRKLRYLFYENRLINKEILEQGLANKYYYSGLKYEKELVNAEEYARENSMGIWTKSQETCANCIILLGINVTEDSFKIKNKCEFDCLLEGWFVRDAGRKIVKLNNINSGEEKTYTSKEDIWNNKGDQFFMFDKNGYLVIYYNYP